MEMQKCRCTSDKGRKRQVHVVIVLDGRRKQAQVSEVRAVGKVMQYVSRGWNVLQIIVLQIIVLRPAQNEREQATICGQTFPDEGDLSLDFPSMINGNDDVPLALSVFLAGAPALTYLHLIGF
jgi:hypothetical protein